MQIDENHKIYSVKFSGSINWVDVFLKLMIGSHGNDRSKYQIQTCSDFCFLNCADTARINL